MTGCGKGKHYFGMIRTAVPGCNKSKHYPGMICTGVPVTGRDAPIIYELLLAYPWHMKHGDRTPSLWIC